MGQCGCGDLHIIAAFPVPGTDGILAVDEYHGCQGCDTPAGFRLFFFDREGWEEYSWCFSGTLGEPLEPDAFGGRDGFGERFPFVGRHELMKAARQGEELRDVDPAEYASVADLVDQWGLTLLQEALRQREERR